MDPIVGAGALRTARFYEATGRDARALRHEIARGLLVRVRRGAYVPAEIWAPLSPRQRERLRIAAAHLVARGAFVASHRSAAALWEVPALHRPDEFVHVLASASAGSRTEHGFVRHSVADAALHRVAVHGIPCTSLERTIVDLAQTESFEEAVVAADWSLRTHTDADALRRTISELHGTHAKARAVVEFANCNAGSVGESRSRVQIADAGLPAPLLQVPFYDDLGLIGVVDFYWPEFGVVGEFDGRVKYTDAAMLAGRHPGDVVFAEKRREDRLRAVGARVARWVWSDLNQPGRLAQILLDAGVRRRAA